MEITKITRQKIFDYFLMEKVEWCGLLSEPDFLNRLYDLKNMKSFDQRFSDAERDIWQHRVNNFDWEDDWILNDPRFNLGNVSDEEFLRFLCETLHPVVRRDSEELNALLSYYNDCLKFDGWEIYEKQFISGHPIFTFRKILANSNQAIKAAKTLTTVVDTSYLHTQINRLENSIDNDPELAIGTAKEFLETVCKTILLEKGVELKNPEFPKLVRETLRKLKLSPDDIPNEAKASDTIKLMLMNLATISNSLAELRNPYGSGHGKEANIKGLEPRHARLAVGAATTLAVFIFETYQSRKDA